MKRGHSVKEGWERKQPKQPSAYTNGNTDRCPYCQQILAYRYYGKLYGVRDLATEYKRCPLAPIPNKGRRCYVCDRPRRLYGRYGLCFNCRYSHIPKLFLVCLVIGMLIWTVKVERMGYLFAPYGQAINGKICNLTDNGVTRYYRSPLYRMGLHC